MLRKSLHGVVCDLDGTLRIPPSLDLKALLSSLANRKFPSKDEAELARQAVERAKALRSSGKASLPGALELCDFIDSIPLPRAIITLSSRADVQKHEAKELARASRRFSPIFGGQEKVVKPSPEPLLRVCHKWGVEPGQVLMVGDSAKYDVACGNSAGAITCLIDPLFRYRIDELTGERRPDFVVHSLHEIQELIRKIGYVPFDCKFD
ncbi:haloacid dehalogenase-like hydrolase domain-containing protein At2g33255 [Selaginella moellendorffii]|uniref:haloacid dehalogenase-like hydrolase domain-containing protein At2g33255 n=1 Tax=Selaginella moellendorffii TaxID=88036 RepID=UPI000D1D0D10|nr:haloacid dehalogenase-like hydrolase domain-containing protein At2g33255 [Selaginella moellendorffii]|eukprot:XP_024539423.1 haloacid dehalogenase-like hydrolase domain-containing protein At2g33255 [Selaginella moellendorffii]